MLTIFPLRLDPWKAIKFNLLQPGVIGGSFEFALPITDGDFSAAKSRQSAATFRQ